MRVKPDRDKRGSSMRTAKDCMHFGRSLLCVRDCVSDPTAWNPRPNWGPFWEARRYSTVTVSGCDLASTPPFCARALGAASGLADVWAGFSFP